MKEELLTNSHLGLGIDVGPPQDETLDAVGMAFEGSCVECRPRVALRVSTAHTLHARSSRGGRRDKLAADGAVARSLTGVAQSTSAPASMSSFIWSRSPLLAAQNMASFPLILPRVDCRRTVIFAVLAAALSLEWAESVWMPCLDEGNMNQLTSSAEG